MANKLPWFTHDHDAHDDPFIVSAMDRFGPLGYMAYFVILELLHKDGNGDILRISAARLCLKLRTKRKVIGNILGMFQEASKIVFTCNGDDYCIQIKKFRERQSNMKSKTISRPFQNHSKTTQEGEGEGEGEKKHIVPAGPKSETPKTLTPIQRIIKAYKIVKGVNVENLEESRAWDKANFAKSAKHAKEILDVFAGNTEYAVAFVIFQGNQWTDAGLVDWTLYALIEQAANKRHNFGGSHGTAQAQVENSPIFEPKQPRRIAQHGAKIQSAGEILGDGAFRLERTVSSAERSSTILEGPEDEF